MKIFISHHHSFAGNLTELKSSLSLLDVDCFLAHEDIHTGEYFHEKIIENIKDCDIFLLVGTKDALESKYVQQEIGMALGYEKAIISTITKDADPRDLCFLKNQQAMSFRDCDTLIKSVTEEILKSEYKDFWNEKMEIVSKSKYRFFSTQQAPENGLYLEKDNWNDHGYNTRFLLKINQTNEFIGTAKIAHPDLESAIYRYHSYTPPKIAHSCGYLPQYPFCYLPNNFVSYVNFSLADLGEDKVEGKKEICRRLNDIRYVDPSRAKDYVHLDIAKKSLFRDRPDEWEELVKRIDPNSQ